MGDLPVVTWSGRCLNETCPIRQAFKIQASGDVVSFLLCRGCNTRHVLHIRASDPPVIKFVIDQSRSFSWEAAETGED